MNTYKNQSGFVAGDTVKVDDQPYNGVGIVTFTLVGGCCVCTKPGLKPHSIGDNDKEFHLFFDNDALELVYPWDHDL